MKLMIYDLRFKNRIQGGFTLIELLIVVAIIGILSTLIMVNFIGIRQRARDAQRKSNLRQIQSALELYRSDSGSYPAALGNCGTSLGNSDCTTIYLQKIPSDPLNSGEYVYEYTFNGSSYSLHSCLENVNDSQKDNTNTGCTGGTTDWSFTLQSP